MLVKKMNYLIGVVYFLLILVGSTSCKKKSSMDTLPPAIPVISQNTVSTPSQETTLKPLYVYTGDRFRDPFSPTGTITTYTPEALFDPKKTVVKGIIYSSNFKSAVISVTGSGIFFINHQRIFDVMGKIVKGYTAKVLLDRVIVLGEADTSYEIKLRNKDEEAKTL